MFNIKIESKFFLLLFTFLFILLIGYIDFKTIPDLSFSIFYLIPLSLLALHRSSSLTLIIISSVFALIILFLAELFGKDFSTVLIPIWNSVTRLIIFIFVGYLLFSLKAKNKKLDFLNEEKNKFVGIAAHDLRNPIGGIFSFTEILLTLHEKSLKPEVHEIISFIRKMSNNCLVMIKELLDISKIESGKVNLKPEYQNYTSFLKEQVHLNQYLAENKNIKIKLNSPEKILACFDAHYLSEVIDNLISNAIKYSYRNSEILVNVTLNGKSLLTEVIDKGKGIPVHEQQNVFNYFQKTSTKPTEGETSTGLGLAIAKRIISDHNGQIGVSSEVEKGANFYFSIPLEC